jgi:hypothetical protein
MTDPIYRYTYTSRRDGRRYTARVTLHSRHENEGVVLLFLRAIGPWPDRKDLTELAEAAEKKGTPLVSGVMLPAEDEDEWREANLRPEEGWKG